MLLSASPSETFIQNHTFDEIRVGDSARVVRVLRTEDIQLFAAISGDINPTHLDPEFAHSGQFREIVAHSLWGGTLVSAILGSEFPGPGTVYVSQSFRFRRPVTVGDTLTVTVTCREMHGHNHHIVFDCLATNQGGVTVMDGVAEVSAPTEKIRRPRVLPPEVRISDQEERLRRLLSLAEGMLPLPTAVVCPCDAPSLRATFLARDTGSIVPILVGPARNIHQLAENLGLKLKGLRMIDVPEERSTEVSIALCHDGQAHALMQGSLHVAPFMRTVLTRSNGLRTSRRASHAFLVSTPYYPKFLLLTDAVLNIAPTLEEKADIIQNAIELFGLFGVNEPKVALVTASDSIDPRMPVTVEAAKLCSMAAAGRIQGGQLSGPLTFDAAISPGEGCLPKEGADVLFVPNIEAGHMMAKQFEYLSGALMGGVVLGTKIPVVLARQADTVQTRAVSCIIARLLNHHKKGDTLT